MLNERRAGAEGGFLLIDLLTASILVSVMFAMFAGLMVAIVDRDSTLMDQADLATGARPTLDTLAGELQSAMCNDTAAPVTAASGTSITFTAPDRQQPFHLRRISYTLAGGTFSRSQTLSTNTDGPPWTMGSTGAAATAVTSVSNATVFHFYDSSGTDLSPSGAAVAAAKLATIAKVTITLTVVPVASRGTGPLTVQQGATLRTPQCNI